MIGVSTREFGSHASFYDYLHLLNKPGSCMASFVHGQSPAAARNHLIEAALEHDCTHIFFLDDDMSFKPDLLDNLLKHDVDVVSGFYLMRQYPHQAIVFNEEMPDGQARWMRIRSEHQGLIEVTHTGLGCALFNLRVFEKMEKPWVRLGEVQKDAWCDDIGLYNRVRAAGFKVYVDLDQRVGHMCYVTVTPDFRENTWMVGYNTQGSKNVQFPMVVEEGNDTRTDQQSK